ncbi:hypothetical protein AGDE_03524 [Angomonas deanei]|nr:hypothetical protein AGDE_03606 [Angomonas deanei]EPY40404.1 hypothetical protein AGDE_03524 [Angomonas deanei]|eukprot:EPY40322.1 hypothetical protein AGDE_03606 [Angomonas deanei]
MLRRSTTVLFGSFERNWDNKRVFPHDRTGRFNLDEAALELDLDPEYVASLYRPAHYTYAVRGQRYPAEQGRAGRPGSSSSARDRMFPLYKRNYHLNKEYRVLDWRRVTTE